MLDMWCTIGWCNFVFVSITIPHIYGKSLEFYDSKNSLMFIVLTLLCFFSMFSFLPSLSQCMQTCLK